MGTPVIQSRIARRLRRIPRIPRIPLTLAGRAPRLLGVCLIAAVAVTCADQSTALKRSSLGRLPIAPAFQTGPAGGPDIEIETIRGVLRRQNSNDSSVAVAAVDGDSAILEFANVTVNGDSTNYLLNVTALDSTDEVVFQGTDTVGIKPGDNAPAAPVMHYVDTDTAAASILIAPRSLSMDWAGAQPNNTLCLNRVPNAASNTVDTLTVTAKNAANQNVSNVRVGWLSTDTSVVVVDNGIVRSRCSNKTAYIVARTFLNKVDSIPVTVSAPAFTLIMNEDSTDVQRNKSFQLTALVVDENSNQVPASAVTWGSSDTTRAKVNSAGLVTGLRNGRVLITATSGGRATVSIIQVVRPVADLVKVVPVKDSIGVGQVTQFFAKAFDAAGRVISDAVDFIWSSARPGAAFVSDVGVVTGLNSPDTSVISATIDGKTGIGVIRVITMPPGTIKGRVVNGANDVPVQGATISRPGFSATSGSDGSFILDGVVAGDSLTVTSASFATVVFYNAPAFPTQVIVVPDLPLTSASGSLSGKVVNALNGAGVGGASIKVYSGLNAAPSLRRPNPNVITTTTTSSSGTYSIPSVAAGAYTIVATLDGYSQGVTVGVPGRSSPDMILAPATSSGLFAVVTWGSCGSANVPCDIDGHVTGPKTGSDTGRFNVFTASRAYVSGTDTVASLDADRSQGSGPEVVSLRAAAQTGVHRFYVRNVSTGNLAINHSLADSAKARVDVLQGNRVIATFFPPPGQPGNLWEVFRFDGARLMPVNQIMHTADAAFADDGAPPPIEVAGSWRGSPTLTREDGQSGSQEVTFTLTRNGSAVSGSWQLTGDSHVTPVRGTIFGTRLILTSAEPVSSIDDCYKFPWTWRFNVSASSLTVTGVVGTDCLGDGSGGHTSVKAITGGTGTLAKLP
jgi:hypothetical protein